MTGCFPLLLTLEALTKRPKVKYYSGRQPDRPEHSNSQQAVAICCTVKISESLMIRLVRDRNAWKTGM